MKGNWKQISTNSLKLNTFEQPKNSRTTYIGKINPDRTDNIKISIRDLELPLAAASIVINDNTTGKATDINGIILFDYQEIKKITFFFLAQNETVEIDNPKYNEIEIIVKDLDLSPSPRFLTNKIMTLNKHKLFINDHFFFQKTNLKHKQ